MSNELDLSLFEEIKNLIITSKEQTYQYINTQMSWLYFHVGRLLQEQIVKSGEDAKKSRLESLSKKLTQEFGRGWGIQQLRHCLHFYRTFKDYKYLNEMISSLSWSVIKEIMYIKEPLKREFYIVTAQNNRWSVREIRRQKERLFYERTSLSKEPDLIIKKELKEARENQSVSPNMIFKDPYLLDFLNLEGEYHEKDLEDALVNDIIDTIREFGTDFSFLARQYRIEVENDDYYIDLLLYHRGLKSLVAIELKTRPFEPKDKGQMEFYLKWLDKYDRKPGENPPIGLILCTDIKNDYFNLLELNEGNLRAAQYLLETPDMKLLEEKLKEKIKNSQDQYLIEHSEDKK